MKSKPLLTILGAVDYKRSLNVACNQTRYPGDEQLDVVDTTRSPGTRRMMARAGSRSTFKDGHDDLKIYAGIEVSAKDIERVAERIGADMEHWSQSSAKPLSNRIFRCKLKRRFPLCTYPTTPGVPMIASELEGRKGKHPMEAQKPAR